MTSTSEREIMSQLEQWWLEWNLRVVILICLFLQTVLLVMAPMRKQTVSVVVVVPIWLAYTFADPIAYFALGLIFRTHVTASSPDPSTASSSPYVHPGLLALWASFFLVFLGRPITATAFALEDNEMWLRQLLRLGFPGWVVFYALSQIPPTNDLRVTAWLMFIWGLIKNLQRIRCLYLVSSRMLKKSFLHQIDGNDTDVGNLDDLGSEYNMLKDPFTFFKSFKVLIADMKLSIHTGRKSREFFLQRVPAAHAFDLVERELKFFYNFLYTKATMMDASDIISHLYLFPSAILKLLCLLLFNLAETQRFRSIDVVITNTLLIGVIVQEEIIGFFLVQKYFSSVLWVLTYTVVVLLRKVGMRWPEDSKGLAGKIVGFLTRNWSQSISQYNMVRYCLHPRGENQEKIISFFGLTEVLDERKYVETARFTSYFRELIFDELKYKSEKAKNIEMAKDNIYPARGDWVLGDENCTKLLPWINKVSFDESLLLWHIATELCFQATVKDVKELPTDSNRDFRGMSKHLSDYLMYLLIVHPTIMYHLEGKGKIRFKHTCAEVNKLFRKRNIGEDMIQKEACESILNIHLSASSERGFAKGDGSTSVLSNACELSIELNELEEERKWKIISRVWVEMLCYSACRCRGMVHAAQLSKGGQLITVVWLLMAHLGLGDHFEGD